MAAGTHYNVTPEYKPREYYRVESGVRKSGAWKLDITNLTVGETLPVFTPVQADLAARTVVPVRNFKVYEAYTNGETALTIKVDKTVLAYVGMHVGNGSKGATVTNIDKSHKDYDVLTIAAAFGANLTKGAVIFETTAAGGTTKKNTANFVLFDEKKVESDGPVLVTLLMQAYEIKQNKLPIPIAEADKTGLTSRFQFEY